MKPEMKNIILIMLAMVAVLIEASIAKSQELSISKEFVISPIYDINNLKTKLSDSIEICDILFFDDFYIESFLPKGKKPEPKKVFLVKVDTFLRESHYGMDSTVLFLRKKGYRPVSSAYLLGLIYQYPNIIKDYHSIYSLKDDIPLLNIYKEVLKNELKDNVRNLLWICRGHDHYLKNICTLPVLDSNKDMFFNRWFILEKITKIKKMK